MPRYFMFNKPKGCVTARTDSLSKTVMDYFPEECRQTMYPVGRLDKDTEGLLLITDDGMLCRKLLLPKSHVPKTYFFYAIGELTEEKVSAISEGVEMKGRELHGHGSYHRHCGISFGRQKRTSAQISPAEDIFGLHHHNRGKKASGKANDALHRLLYRISQTHRHGQRSP